MYNLLNEINNIIDLLLMLGELIGSKESLRLFWSLHLLLHFVTST